MAEAQAKLSCSYRISQGAKQTCDESLEEQAYSKGINHCERLVSAMDLVKHMGNMDTTPLERMRMVSKVANTICAKMLTNGIPTNSKL
eukprot:6136069-Amphidinium_carterae.1